MLRDFKCNQCGWVEQDKLVTFKGLTLPWDCPSCALGLMIPLPCAPAFVIDGYSAKNGYTSKSNT